MERVFLMDNECHSLSNIVFTDFKIYITLSLARSFASFMLVCAFNNKYRMRCCA